MKPWLDRAKLRPGDELTERLTQTIEPARCVVVLLSRAAVASRWVQAETEIAVRQMSETGLQIVPLLLEECNIPEHLADLVHIDCRSGLEAKLPELMATLNRLQEETPAWRIASEEAHAIDHALAVLRINDNFVLELDVVCSDFDEEFTVLAQFVYTADEAASRHRFGVETDAELANLLLETTRSEFRGESVVLMLHGADVYRDIFTIADGEAVVTVKSRVRRLGTLGVTMPFDLGAVFESVCESRMPG